MPTTIHSSKDESNRQLITDNAQPTIPEINHPLFGGYDVSFRLNQIEV
jgi:hypothetical protein